MIEQQQHEMILDTTHPSGADEWYCPTCGRRLLMNYAPEFKKIVLNAGDEYAIHSGAKGGLQIGSMHVESAAQPDSAINSEDPRLALWASWLDDVDFDSLWDKKD